MWSFFNFLVELIISTDAIGKSGFARVVLRVILPPPFCESGISQLISSMKLNHSRPTMKMLLVLLYSTSKFLLWIVSNCNGCSSWFKEIIWCLKTWSNDKGKKQNSRYSIVTKSELEKKIRIRTVHFFSLMNFSWNRI